MISAVPRFSPVVVSVVAWTAGAATAVAVGLLALSAIGVGLTDDAVRSLSTNPPYEADPTTPNAPATTATTATSPRPETTPPRDGGSERTVMSRGGNVVARCRASGAYLVGWSPAPGYRAVDVARGPAPTARLTFVAHDSEVKITVRCVGGAVQSSIEDERGDD